MKVPFWKVEAVGNDFVLVRMEDFPEADARLPEIAKAVSPRRFAVGSDGLLAIGRDKDRLVLRMFNPDGTEDFCGNGLRCAAAFANIQGWVGDSVEIEHVGQVVPTRVSADSRSRRRVRTRIGPATFDPSRVPLRPGQSELFEVTFSVLGQEVILSSLSTGSTHTVLFVDELPDDHRFRSISAALETDPTWPARTSVIWARPFQDSLRIRIWERGAGETMGCGTGSSAAAAAWFRKTGGNGIIQVVNPGGTVLTEMASWDAPIEIESPAEVVYQGTIEL